MAERYPDSTYEEEALFLVGENYYNERIFDLAAEAYTELMGQYPSGKYNDVAQYALAWSFFEQEDMEEGVEAMKMLVSRYPRSEFASKALYSLFHLSSSGIVCLRRLHRFWRTKALEATTNTAEQTCDKSCALILLRYSLESNRLEIA